MINMEDSCEIFPSFEHLKTQEPLAVAIGFFDGVHSGHQKVLGEMLRYTLESNHLPAVLTFHPHPSRVVSRNPVKQIFPQSYKFKLLQKFGVQKVICEEFTADLAGESPEVFLKRLKKALPSLSAIYVGEGFHFGQNRSGNTDVLTAICGQLDIKACCITRVCQNGEVVSSSLIRRKIADGLIHEANALLGYPYFASEVIAWEWVATSKKPSIPTFSIPWDPELRPKFGIYSVKVHINQVQFCGVAHYGIGKSLQHIGHTQGPILEVFVENLPSFKDLQKVPVKVEWLALQKEERAMID
jgi:riboflavin kinase / FMN adenylyltransferase